MRDYKLAMCSGHDFCHSLAVKVKKIYYGYEWVSTQTHGQTAFDQLHNELSN